MLPGWAINFFKLYAFGGCTTFPLTPPSFLKTRELPGALPDSRFSMTLATGRNISAHARRQTFLRMSTITSFNVYALDEELTLPSSPNFPPVGETLFQALIKAGEHGHILASASITGLYSTTPSQ